MKKNKIPIISLLLFILIISQSLLGQVRLSYKVIEEYDSPVKEIGGMAILNDTLFIYDIAENKILLSNLLTRKIIQSYQLSNDNIISIGIEPLSREIIALDNNSNILSGNFNEKNNTLSLMKNIQDYEQKECVIKKAHKICFGTNKFFVSTEAGGSSGIFTVTNNFNYLKFFSFTMGIPPVSITFNGKNIWSISKKNSKGGGIISKYGSNGVIEAFAEIDLKNPSNFIYDGLYFWITDNSLNKIIKIDIKEGGN